MREQPFFDNFYPLMQEQPFLAVSDGRVAFCNNLYLLMQEPPFYGNPCPHTRELPLMEVLIPSCDSRLLRWSWSPIATPKSQRLVLNPYEELSAPNSSPMAAIHKKKKKRKRIIEKRKRERKNPLCCQNSNQNPMLSTDFFFFHTMFGFSF